MSLTSILVGVLIGLIAAIITIACIELEIPKDK